MNTSPLIRVDSERYPELVKVYGFVPNLFRAQDNVPGAVQAEEQLLRATILSENRLTRQQKVSLLHAAASASRNDYCRALHMGSPAMDDAQNSALLAFALKLSGYGPWVTAKDIELLSRAGFDDLAIVEAVATTALGQMLCTLAEGFQPLPDSELAHPGPSEFLKPRQPSGWIEPVGPYLKSRAQDPTHFQPYSSLREQLGFIPNLFRAQMLLPDLVQAEVQALDRVLFTEDLLSHTQKEMILLVISAANLNTYGVAVHSQILDALGVPMDDCDQIIQNHQAALISPEDKALLDEARKLSRSPIREQRPLDLVALKSNGFSEQQITEVIAVAALANFLNTVQFGLGTVPDFPPRRVFTPKDLYPGDDQFRPTLEAVPVLDPDAALVAAIQGGDIDQFEQLVQRHSRRIFSTLAGIVGNRDDAHDATQDVFLKAFENIGGFEGRSKFSTWLMSIAINTGTEILRRRKPLEPLESDDQEDFRPRRVQSWTGDPEQLFSAAQRDELVREAILRLPEKYRIALLLRDINQLSTEDAAAILQLGVPAMKARVLRGRLMLRESLASYFSHAGETTDD
jgi:RNA polymerase sigma-70 factor, ECF subfamily